MQVHPHTKETADEETPIEMPRPASSLTQRLAEVANTTEVNMAITLSSTDQSSPCTIETNHDILRLY